MLDDALDGAIFAARIAAFEDDQNLVVMLDDVLLELDQFDLQLLQGIFITLFFDFLGRFFAHGDLDSNELQMSSV